MGSATSISWTDATWNPIRGCQRTAPEGSKQSGCGDASGGGCYAERQAARFCGQGQAYEGLIKLTANGPRWSGKTRYVSEHLMDPFRWTKPRHIFTDSMSDLFYKGVPTHVVDNVVAVMLICCLHETRGGHTFQTLTKRPNRMREYFDDPGTQERVARAAGALMEDGDGWFDTIAHRKNGLLHSKMWWGTSIENQAAADERIDELLCAKVAVRFLSMEPLLGQVDLLPWFDPTGACDCPPEQRYCKPRCAKDAPWRGADDGADPSIDWVIAGCESGPRSRTCETEWLRSIRDRCADHSVPFFLKQAMENNALEHVEPGYSHPIQAVACASGSNRKGSDGRLIELPYLDGKQHAEFPSPSTEHDE